MGYGQMSGWAFDHTLLGVSTYRRYEGGLLHIMVRLVFCVHMYRVWIDTMVRLSCVQVQ